MTRFMLEISGYLGEVRERNARREVAEACKSFKEDATVSPEGIVRWKSNNSIPPEEMLEKMCYGGCKFDFDACEELRKDEERNWLNDYCNSRTPVSDEELFEMQSAFGKGTTVVDVISNEHINI